jgi:leucyl aminopeptidase
MKFSTKLATPDRHRSACVAVGIFESRRLSDAADALDKAAHGQIREFLRSGDMDGKAGSTRLLYRVRGVAAERVMLVGLGQEKEFGEKQFRDGVRAALSAIRNTGARDAYLYLADLQVPGRDTAWKARQLVWAAVEVAYRFDRMKSKKTEAKPLAHVTLAVVSKRDVGALERGTREGLAIAAGMTLARDLGNLPPNVCTPSYLADSAV